MTNVRIDERSHRRLARRGGVLRISRTIYETIRAVLKQRLAEVGFTSSRTPVRFLLAVDAWGH